MIQSMTGYGRTEVNIENTNCTIDIKSLNSKQIDINVRIPSIYKDKEIELRKLISKKLKRGKIDLSIWRKKSELPSNYYLNTKVIKGYYKEVLKLKRDLSITQNRWFKNPFANEFKDIIPSLLEMPDVFEKEQEIVNEDEWTQIQKGVNIAIEQLSIFRTDEGKNLDKDIQQRISKIESYLIDIVPFEKQRIEKIKNNLKKKLEDIQQKYIDDNRFEQELIYYLEKQDITEEKVRLRAHLKYFIESIKSEPPNGKKLAFIAQEIGREINTIGSKSSDADMQKIVVQMKDELEKIKEQLLNIL